MKKISQNLKKQEIKLGIESNEDLWFLSHIIEENDLISAKTTRKIKIGDSENDRSIKTVKKTIFLEIDVEKVEFSSDIDALRVSGKIVEGPDDLPHGHYHTINLEIGNVLTIKKEKWYNFHLKRLNDACKDYKEKMIMCAMDREEAYFAILRGNGLKNLSSFKGDVVKKGFDETKKGDFFVEIKNKIIDYDKKYSPQKIIIASPSFWKEDLLKIITENELKKKIILSTCSYVDKTCFKEVLKRDEIKKAFREDRVINELNLIEKLMYEISKDGLFAYGIDNIEKAAGMGAIETLLISDKLIRKAKEEGDYSKIDNIMMITESNKGEINIISADNEAGLRLDGIGGIGGILRYKI